MENRLRSAHKGLVITTSWDDGHPLDLRVSDLLTKHGLGATFYVPLRNSRPTMSPSQIRELSSMFEIGAHTVNHLRLTNISREQARREIVDSKSQIEDMTGKPCSIFCFPGGYYRHAHLNMLRDAGFAAARTVELFSLKTPREISGVSLIPTTIQAYPHGTTSYLRNVGKRLSLSGLRNLLLGRNVADWSALARILVERAARVGGVFHLWGHSWEIDATGQWHVLEQTFAALAEYRQRASFATNMELCGEIGQPQTDPRSALLSR
jgi:peptidoglycan/xylan/chitin deacetylase (PgdA/CDA1 family)